MPELSSVLKEGIDDADTIRERNFQWAWWFILHKQSKPKLRELLQVIETASLGIEDQQRRLELAWKAQVIESLLEG